MALKIQRYSIVILALTVLFMGCATAPQTPPEQKGTLAVTDISKGLPQSGLWMQNIDLSDLDGDGFVDIVAPPPRQAEKKDNIPHIFAWNQQEGKWKEDAPTFPSLKNYGYGGIAVSDINGDGLPDIVLAVHERKILILENNGKNGFVEKPFPVQNVFRSRTVKVSDVNGDNMPDIIALSEAIFSPKARYIPAGVIVGANKGKGDWDITTIEGSSGLFGDSMAIGDANGDGHKDIIIAPLAHTEERTQLLWFGDGKGAFTAYDGDVIKREVMATFVRAGDIDGDGKDEIVFKVEGFGPEAKIRLCSYKWNGTGFDDISKGLGPATNPIVFDLADVEEKGKKDLVLLSDKGLSIYTYDGKGWTESGFHPLPHDETGGAYVLKTARNRDGSLLIVYNLGRMEKEFNKGIRAYLLK